MPGDPTGRARKGKGSEPGLGITLGYTHRSNGSNQVGFVTIINE